MAGSLSKVDVKLTYDLRVMSQLSWPLDHCQVPNHVWSRKEMNPPPLSHESILLTSWPLKVVAAADGDQSSQRGSSWVSENVTQRFSRLVKFSSLGVARVRLRLTFRPLSLWGPDSSNASSSSSSFSLENVILHLFEPADLSEEYEKKQFKNKWEDASIHDWLSGPTSTEGSRKESL